MLRRADPGRRVLSAELAGQGPHHAHIHARGCRRGRPAAAAAVLGQVPAVGGEHVGVKVPDQRGTAELFSQPHGEGPVDRPILTPRAGTRGPAGDPVSLPEEVAASHLLGKPDGRRRPRCPLPHDDRVDELELADGDVLKRAGGGPISQTRHLGSI